MLDKFRSILIQPERNDASSSSTISRLSSIRPNFLLTKTERDQRLAQELHRRETDAIQKQLAVDTSLAEWMMKQDSDSLAAEEMETMKLVQQLADEEEAERRKIEEVEEEEVRRIMEEEERRINGVVECGICFQEFWRGEEMVQCQEGHLLCPPCASLGASYAFTNSLDPSLSCLVSGTCSATYPPSEAKRFLDKAGWAVWEKLVRERDLRGLDRIVNCPHCTYAVIIEDLDLETLTCLNPACGKLTCLKCHHPYHPDKLCALANPTPLHALEEEMSSTLIRTCPGAGCSSKFVKVGGCNRVVCGVCKKASCYLCNNLIDGYGHFDSGPCKGMMYDDSAITKNVELVRKEGMKKLQTVEERKHAELLKI